MGQTIDEVNNAEGKLQSYKCETYDPSNIHPENIQTLKKIKQTTDLKNGASLENKVNTSDKNKAKIDCDPATDDIFKNGQSENEYPAFNNAKEQEKIRKWLQDLNKTQEFLYVHSASELVLDDDIEKEAFKRICDPYGFIRNDKILEVKNIDTEKIEKIHGKCTVTLKNGDECEGNWRQRKRMGKGTMIGPTLERLAISHLSGNYENGVLTGKGRMLMVDNSILEGWFQQGYLHGPAKGTHSNGKLSWVGWFQAGLAVGTCWQSVEGDAWLVGKVNKDGRMTGDEIAFLYPDLSTALLGTFEEGVLVSAVPAVVDTVRLVDGVMEVDFKKTGGPVYKRWVSTRMDIACPPHQGDMYERSRVQVKVSSVEGAGEGLYARVDLEPGMVVAYYNGLKMNAGEKSSAEFDTGYGIYIDFARTWMEKQNTEHMDIPARYQSIKDYSATLGHKVNHSFDPNMLFDVAEHPCYGRVPTLRAVRKVRAGEELSAHYTMDMENAYDWYREAWEVYSTGGHQMEKVEEQVELKEQVEDKVKDQLDLRNEELENIRNAGEMGETSKEHMDIGWMEQLEDKGKEYRSEDLMEGEQHDIDTGRYGDDINQKATDR